MGSRLHNVNFLNTFVPSQQRDFSGTETLHLRLQTPFKTRGNTLIDDNRGVKRKHFLATRVNQMEHYPS